MSTYLKQTNFTSGEVSPKLKGRTDVAKYDNALETMLNAYALPQGGAIRRSGTRYIAGTKTNSKTSRLVRFEFSTTQAYILEFGDLYMRVFKDQGQVYSAGTTPYELTTTYLEADIATLSFAQSADTLYVFHENYAPRQISRTAHNAWSITDLSFTDGPWGALNLSVTTLQPSQKAATLFDITGITAAKPPVVTATGHTITAGQTVLITGVIGTSEVNNNSYKAESIGANDLALFNTADNTSGTTDGIGGVPSILNETGQTFVTTVSVGDLVHNTTDNTYALVDGVTSNEQLSLDADIMDDAETYHIHSPIDGTAFTAYVTGGSIRATSSAQPTITASDATFVSTDVGRLVTIKHIVGDDTTWGVARITAFNSTTSVDVAILTAFSAITAEVNWKLGSWSETTGYPGLVTFYENRVVAARTATDPQTIWFSKINDYDDFGVSDPIVATDGLSTTLIANDVNVIKWMSPSRMLMVGTAGGEWTIEGDISTGITPTSLRQRRESTYGCIDVGPLHIDDATIFLQRPGRKIREFIYSFDTDSFVAPDLTLLAEHITRVETISAWDFAKEPETMVWAVRSDGILIGITYKRDQQVIAWHRHTTDGEFESVATVPGASANEVWAIVKRTVGGSTVRYVEMLEAEYNADTDTDATNSKYLDSMLTYSGTAVSSVTGLTHLEGETVSVLADGKVHPDCTVASGAITLNYTASVVHAGLGFTSDIQILPIEVDAATGTSSGRTKRVSRVVLKLYESAGCKIGRDSSHLDTVVFNEDQVHGAGTVLFSGDKVIDFEADDSVDAQIFIRQDQPLPLTILSIAMEIDFNAR